MLNPPGSERLSMAGIQEVYLDDNATTRVLPVAAQEAYGVMEELFGNPSSTHIAGLQARRILESARAVARQILGASSGRIVFTSGATEAIQTGIFSALCQAKKNLASAARTEPGLLLYGATEHKAIPQTLHHWNQLLDIGCEVLAIPVDRQGQLDLEFLRAHVDRAHLLCTMAVNNETGVIHDLHALEAIILAAKHKVAWMVDCVQAVGKLELKLSDSAIDYATISGHKLHAPKGIGILYVREDAPFTPLLAGGGQEGGARGGTENLPGVAAIACVLRTIQDPQADEFNDLATLSNYRDRIVASLKQAFPKIVFNTPFEKSVPTTVNFAVPGFTSKELLDLFDAAGIRVSSGSACGSAIRGSYVLEAMGLPKWQSDGAIRLSFGLATTAADVEAACARIEEAGQALADSCLAISPHIRSDSRLASDGLLQLKNGSMCSWILSDHATKKCVVVDPFDEFVERIETIIRCQGYQVVAVLDTHQHVDHQSPRERLVQLLGDRMLNSDASTDILGWPSHAEGEVTLGDRTRAPLIKLSDTNVIAKAPLPGHTVDGQVFLVGTPSDDRLAPQDVRFAFTGDTLLIGGIGRTDFPTSSAEALLESLRKLPQLLADDSVICPTHDYNVGFVTTLGSERRLNRFLARLLDTSVVMSLEEYLPEKETVDGAIQESNCELVCGRIESYTIDGDSSIDVEPEQLKEFFQQHEHSLIVDVREPHEFHFAQDWNSLGFQSPPENVPLTRLGNFLARLPQQADWAEKELIFLCRSGNRSAKAAQVVRRLGLAKAWHITGGIALGMSPSRDVIDAEEMEYSI